MQVRDGDNAGRPFAFAIALGIAGGIALAVTVALTTRGPMVFIAYAAMLIATLLYFREGGVGPFRRRFGVALLAFMLSNVIASIYVLGWRIPNAASRPLWTNVYPFLAMAAIGVVVSALTAIAPVRTRS
jgi:hypothetical protein